MSFRVPPNKGKVEFPVVVHVRCTEAMRSEVAARGGGHWLRSLVSANSRPPEPTAGMIADSDPDEGVGDSPSGDTGLVIRKRVSRIKARAALKGKIRRRVSLDKAKRRRVK